MRRKSIPIDTHRHFYSFHVISQCHHQLACINQHSPLGIPTSGPQSETTFPRRVTEVAQNPSSYFLISSHSSQQSQCQNCGKKPQGPTTLIETSRLTAQLLKVCLEPRMQDPAGSISLQPPSPSSSHFGHAMFKPCVPILP